MAVSPRVQLSLKGRLLSEVAFVGPQLRVGRMRENDVVVNNLAVSRFHATLRREGDGFVLEDLGSENGTHLNGERITGSVPMTASDVVQLGKYELRIVMQPGLAIAGPPKAKASDAWDSSQTFLALDGKPPAAKAHAPVDETAPRPPAKPSLAPAPTERMPDALEEAQTPDPEGVFAFSEEDLAATPDELALPVPAQGATPPAAFDANPEQTSLFDFGAVAGERHPVEETPPSLAAGAAEPEAAPAPSSDAAPLYAGLIVQREGKLHQLKSWEDGDLTAGRLHECDLVLADAGVSRRHAMFSAADGAHSVRDLGSVNGLYVNGQRTKEHVLAVGDVVRIESFELTFVLDRQPIGREVSAPAPSGSSETDAVCATQLSQEGPADEPIDLAPLAGDPTDAPGFDPADLTAEPIAGVADTAGDEEEPFDLAPLAGDPALAPGLALDLSSDGPDDLDAFPPAIDPIPAPPPDGLSSAEAHLPEADLVTDDDPDDEDKDPPLRSAERAERPAANASFAARRSMALRVAIDADKLSPRAREALAMLEEEGVTLSAQLSFDAAGED